jgi:hypothetical protein
MRRNGHPSRPRETCCLLSSLKTLLKPTKATVPHVGINVPSFILVGRFSGDPHWPLGVTPEVATPSSRLDVESMPSFAPNTQRAASRCVQGVVPCCLRHSLGRDANRKSKARCFSRNYSGLYGWCSFLQCGRRRRNVFRLWTLWPEGIGASLFALSRVDCLVALCTLYGVGCACCRDNYLRPSAWWDWRNQADGIVPRMVAVLRVVARAIGRRTRVAWLSTSSPPAKVFSTLGQRDFRNRLWLMCRKANLCDLFSGHTTPMHHNCKQNASACVQEQQRHQNTERDRACREQGEDGERREEHVDVPRTRLAQSCRSHYGSGLGGWHYWWKAGCIPITKTVTVVTSPLHSSWPCAGHLSVIAWFRKP